MSSKILRDVMNSKSSNHFRHSVDGYDIKKLSFYYAIESRIFNATWNQENEKYQKGKLWFSNIMVFDFDFDEKHFPNIEDYEKKLKNSLDKLESLLGKPKYKIFNKDPKDFNKFEREVYFTKNGELNFPKKCGCQVVYELKDSIKSQYKEVIKLYNCLRMYINNETDADINFKGHMFKNFYNKRLFDVIENEDYDLLDIFELSIKYKIKDEKTIKLIKELPAFCEFYNDVLPKQFKSLNSRLFNFYQELNTWKTKNNKINYKRSITALNSKEFSDLSSSRNETLFSYMKIIPLDLLKILKYNEVVNSNLFSNCDIKENIEEKEFDATKESVLEYRKENNIESLSIPNIVDNRVLKIKQKEFDKNYFENNKTKIDKAIKLTNKKMIGIKWNDSNIQIKLYPNNSNCNILSNIFLLMGPEESLSNIRNFMTPKFVTYINEYFGGNFGLWDIYCIIKDAIYLTHFKYYRSIQNFRHSNKIIVKNKISSKKLIKNKSLKVSGINYKGNILGFGKFYKKLKKSGLLKSNGEPQPISFYQQHFHIRNINATIFVRLIKKYLKNLNMLKIKILKITSQRKYVLIKIFNINYLFNIKDKYCLCYYGNKLHNYYNDEYFYLS